MLWCVNYTLIKAFENNFRVPGNSLDQGGGGRIVAGVQLTRLDHEQGI